ncbi:hypothetical protein HMPREF3190_00970 [Umbribacter vaginalis]|nr:hypothetical protein HMPREF3190_00970 [Coriobacteriales bacterium DNF00809]
MFAHKNVAIPLNYEFSVIAENRDAHACGRASFCMFENCRRLRDAHACGRGCKVDQQERE